MPLVGLMTQSVYLRGSVRCLGPGRPEYVLRSAYEIPEQRILDSADETRVIWRAAGTVSPPLYPAGAAELLA